MRTTIVTCVLVAASAAIAAAAPGPQETTERISYNEHARRRPATAPEPGWIELASATPASHGREFVVVGADAGTFTQLRITAASGRPEIHSVRVDYQDGSHKVFQVDRVLDAKRRPAYLDLRGDHELKQIVVVTDRKSSGSYVLEGNTGETRVSHR
jgi:hypothetical protein